MARCKPCKTLNLSVFLLIGGFLLTVNPVWGITDILPDALAWVMIWFGLRSFSELNDHMASARKQALYLMGIGTAKLLLSIPLQDSLIRSDKMLAALIFSFGEVACGLLFFRRFFGGIEAFARRADSQGTYHRLENVRFLCSLFLIVRACASLIPTLTAIPDWLVQYGEILEDSTFNTLSGLAAMEDLLNMALSVLVLILAVVWLWSFLPLLASFRRDASLVSYFNDVLEGEDPRRMLNRRFSHLHMARLCFGLALFFPLDLQMDGIRILPLFGFPAFLAIGCLFMERFAGQKSYRRVAWMGAWCTVLLLAAEVYRMRFTVWDLRSFQELETSMELLSSLVIFVCFLFVFILWNAFAKEMEQTAECLQCGRLYLTGIPYVLLLLYAALHTVVFAVPLMLKILNVFHIALVAGLWISSNRILAAFQETAQRKLLENMPAELLDTDPEA